MILSFIHRQPTLAQIDPKVLLAWLPELIEHQEKLADVPDPTDDEKATLEHLSHLQAWDHHHPACPASLLQVRYHWLFSLITF